MQSRRIMDDRDGLQETVRELGAINMAMMTMMKRYTMRDINNQMVSMKMEVVRYALWKSIKPSFLRVERTEFFRQPM